MTVEPSHPARFEVGDRVTYVGSTGIPQQTFAVAHIDWLPERDTWGYRDREGYGAIEDHLVPAQVAVLGTGGLAQAIAAKHAELVDAGLMAPVEPPGSPLPGITGPIILEMEAVEPTQADALAYVAERWPHRTHPEARALKLCEEAGEVAGAVGKWIEGEGRKDEADIRQECAQVQLVLLSLAETVGFDLEDATAEEWHRAMKKKAKREAHHEG